MTARIYLLLIALLPAWPTAGAAEKAAARRSTASRPPEIAAADSAKRTTHDVRMYEKRGPFMENDTLFLYKSTLYAPESDLTFHYTAYVEQNPQSAPYRELEARSSLDSREGERDLAEQRKLLKKRFPGPFPVQPLRDCPRRWIPVNSFQGRYYVDMEHLRPVWISDSLYIRSTTDGPVPSVIRSFEREGPDHFRFRTADRFGGTRTVDLYLLDTVRKIAVFATRCQDSEPVRYGLYAPYETACELDLVVWETTEMPAGDEIAWDPIPFEELIGGQTSLPRGDGTEKTEQR